LYDDIEKASLKKRKDRVVISLVKKKKDAEMSDGDGDGDGGDKKDGVKDWPCIGAVGAPKE